ncbi:MAG: methyltransferase FkbM family [Solirubrobacterales bacterium]|nr:methyltransferase FkbM family [Solirubrobacterales bacterium]
MSREQGGRGWWYKLRPAKVRNALRRRWFERRVPRLALRPAPGLVHLGSSYGGWIIPGGLIDPSWICYSIGAGGDIAFDLELIQGYGITVRAFDAVAGYVEDAAEQGAHEPRFSAHHAAIATSDGPLRMQLTHDPHSRSVSPAGLYESKQFVELPGRTLRSAMHELGDDRIDLLKLDIEGGEYELLPATSPGELGVKILATQLHHNGSVRDARALIARLGEEGYEPVACRKAVKVTFVRRDLL